MEIDFEGSKQEYSKKYGIPQDSYKATLVNVSEPFETPGYENENIMTEKVTLEFDIELPEDIKEVKTFEVDNQGIDVMKIVKLPMFSTTKISKGSGKYSNSKMYDIIHILGLDFKLKQEKESLRGESGYDSKKFTEWLKTNSMGCVVKVQVKNSKTGISRVSEINRLIDNPHVVKEEKVE